MATKDEKIFIRNVRNYMVENHLNNKEMAKKVEMSDNNLCSVLNEKYGVSMPFAKKFCEVSGMTIAQAFSPDPKQFGEDVEGDVQDGNAVAMMELMKKQMDELKEKNKKLEEVEESLRKRIKELQEENEAILKHRNMVVDHNVSLRQENTKLREENEALEQENLRLVSEEYHGKDKPIIEPVKWVLNVNTYDNNIGGPNSYIDTGKFEYGVENVRNIDPFNKTVDLTLYCHEIIIK